jgi:hypothetical protein
LKILVVPEDPKHDQHILKPVVARLFADLGKTARIDVLARPRLRGVAQALDRAVLAEVVATYPMIDLFLVLVDRDGDERRQAVAAAREAEQAGRLLVCLAIEEIEIWMLALHHDKLGASWRAVRREISLKERFAQPFLAKHAPGSAPGDGCSWAMRGLGGQWKGACRRCPELAELRDRIQRWLEAGALA